MHRAQLSQLAELINTVSGPVLTSGDFNTAADSVFYREFRERVNVIDVFERDNHPTFRSEFLPSNRSPRRIDYVFVARSPQLRIAEAMHILKEQPALSDHYGLQAILEFNT
jgi:endonuclease/exonuclease/phosphatase family metal-dependent hydrolase